MVDWVGQEREGILHAHLVQDVHLVDFTPPHMKLRLSERAPKDLIQRLEVLLKKAKGNGWTIAISDEIGHLTLQEKSQKASAERRAEILKEPLVTLLMEALPGTVLVNVEDIEGE